MSETGATIRCVCGALVDVRYGQTGDCACGAVLEVRKTKGGDVQPFAHLAGLGKIVQAEAYKFDMVTNTKTRQVAVVGWLYD